MDNPTQPRVLQFVDTGRYKDSPPPAHVADNSCLSRVCLPRSLRLSLSVLPPLSPFSMPFSAGAMAGGAVCLLAIIGLEERSRSGREIVCFILLQPLKVCQDYRDCRRTNTHHVSVVVSTRPLSSLQFSSRAERENKTSFDSRILPDLQLDVRIRIYDAYFRCSTA